MSYCHYLVLKIISSKSLPSRNIHSWNFTLHCLPCHCLWYCCDFMMNVCGLYLKRLAFRYVQRKYSQGYRPGDRAGCGMSLWKIYLRTSTSCWQMKKKQWLVLKDIPHTSTNMVTVFNLNDHSVKLYIYICTHPTRKKEKKTAVHGKPIDFKIFTFLSLDQQQILHIFAGCL